MLKKEKDSWGTAALGKISEKGEQNGTFVLTDSKRNFKCARGREA